MYAHKGRRKKLHGLHGFALDQPSINGIGRINRSEKRKRSETVGNGRKTVGKRSEKGSEKRSETVGNMIRPKLVQPAFFSKWAFPRNAVCFLKVQRCPRGNSWKQSEIAPLLGKKTGLWGCDPPCSTPWDSPRPKQHVAIAGNVGRAEDGGHLVLSCGSSPWRMWKSLGFLGKKIYKSGFSTSILVYPKVTNGETELTRKPQENCH